MSLSITRITFKRFRNYPELELDKIGLLTIFVGSNAVGKTNIIEGIQLLTSLSSLRKATTNQLITWGEESLLIEVNEKSASRDLDVSLQILEGKKTYTVNNKKKNPKEIRGILPSVVFSPDDLCLIKGTQSIKRNSIDSIGIQIHANYHTVKKDYEKLIHHKNLLLKEDRDPELLQSINEMLCVIGSKFQSYRSALFKRMAPFIKDYYQAIVEKKEVLTCSYTPFWEDYDPEKELSYTFAQEECKKKFTNVLKERSYEEKARKSALFGPHADKIDFFINGKNAGIYGSQGQQRSLVLAFKMAEVALIQEITHLKPILLLDDVMSELDSKRRSALLSLLSGDIQTFITTTTLDYFPKDIIKQADIIELPLKKAGEKA